MRRRGWALALAALLLAGCAGPGEPEPTPPPSELTWLHGFYAGSSYSQIHLALEMDAVSLGWGRMYLDGAGAPYVNTTGAEGNTWVVPQSPQLATDALAEAGVAYNLCVYASNTQRYGEEGLVEYLCSPQVRAETARALAEAAADYGGLTLDFEGLADRGRREDFAALVALVREALGEGQALYVAVPPDTWFKGYDYRALGRLCDRVILMAHDYQWTQAPEEALGTLATDTPVAPIGAVEAALRAVTDPETGVEDRGKIALAVAFAAAGVEVDEAGALAGTRVYSPAPETLARRLAQEDAQPGWSQEYASPYVYYHDEEGTRYRVWYEDARSVEAKIRLCLDYGVTGLSLWRLGTIPDFDNYDVWSAVRRASGR